MADEFIVFLNANAGRIVEQAQRRGFVHTRPIIRMRPSTVVLNAEFMRIASFMQR